MSEEYKFVLVKCVGKLCVITFNDPKKTNFFNPDRYKEVTKALNHAAANESICAIAITGSGKFFSSGNDLKTFTDRESIKNGISTSVLRDFFYAFLDCPKLLIAVVNGPAIGVGATMCGLCDIVYASNTTFFYTPFVPLGICPEGCSSYTFPKLMGKSKAYETLILGKKLSAEEALRVNFIAAIFAPDELDTKIWPKIEKLCDFPAHSSKISKMLLQKHELEVLKSVCEMELNELDKIIQSEEGIQCLLNFINKQ